MKREAAARTAAVGPGLARPTLAKVLVPSCTTLARILGGGGFVATP